MRERALALLLLALPVGWVAAAGGGALGPFSVDLGGHLWNGWALGREGFFRTRLIGWPEGTDLLPVLGGWLDLFGVAALRGILPLEVAYNVVAGAYVALAGLGGWVLARSLGTSRPAALLAGLLLQLDGFLLLHLRGGRLEQVGVGLLALLLGLTFQTFRRPGRAAPALAGLACAALALCSWEMLLLGGLAIAVLVPALARGPRAPGLRARLGLALLPVAAVALPWCALFLAHAAAARGLDEGRFSREIAARASVGLLGWLRPGQARPCWLALTCLPALAWALRRERALCATVAMGLGGALILALGPRPGLLTPGDLGVVGPFAAVQGLPVLGWFHWPDRLLAVWSLAAAAGAALAADLAARRGRPLAILLGAALLADAGLEARASGRWPAAGFRLPAAPGVARLGALQEPGAVLDLPIQPDPASRVDAQIDQIAHGRPLLFGLVQPHLLAAHADIAGDPVLAWFRDLMVGREGRRARFSDADLAGLRAAGVGFVVLRRRGWPARRFARAEAVLRATLGDPVIQQGPDWTCWRLGAPPQD